jgi:acetyltransferase-like isoleucine patch superfamily enzyme
VEDHVNQQESDDGLFDHCPWLYAEQASQRQRAAQEQRRKRLLGGAGSVRLGEGCFVAETAAVYPDVLHLGDRSYIAAHAYVTGDIRTGADCTINPFTVVRGTVTLGDAVRIGAHSSLLAFNHGTSPDLPVHQQPVTSRGITVGDDVWIGSHVVVVDGVTIGDHCVVGAGAVVTKDLPAWTVAAGNPARRIRDRREPRGAAQGAEVPDGAARGAATSGSEAAGPRSRPAAEPLTGPLRGAPHPAREPSAFAGDLSAFAAAARAQAADLLDRCRQPGTGRYVDRPGAEPTVRAHCDAVEIAQLLLGEAPPHLPAAEHAARLRALQDPVTGLVPEYGAAPPVPGPAGLPEDGASAYHVLCVGYALDLLGSSFAHPVHTSSPTVIPRLVTGC